MQIPNNKILILNPFGSYNKNSVAKVVNLYNDILKEHHDVKVLTYNLEVEKENYISLFNSNSSLRILFYMYNYFPYYIKRLLKKYFYTTRLDFILFWIYTKKYLKNNKNIGLIVIHGNPIYLKLLKRSNIQQKTLFHLHNSSIENFSTVSAKEIIDQASGIICLNNIVINDVIHKYRYFDIWYVPNCIHRSKGKDLIKQHRYPVTFLYVGRIVKDKFILELCKYFEKIFENNNGFNLQLAGGFFDKKYELEFLDIIKKSKHINYLGFLNESKLEEEYKNSDYVVLLSESEGSPLCLLEGALYNCELIASDITGCKEIISAFGGYLVEMNNLQSSLSDIFSTIKGNGSIEKKLPCRKMQKNFENSTFKQRILNVIYYISNVKSDILN